MPDATDDELWYKNAIVYAIDVELFQDSDNDGIGDFPGLTSRLPYLARLGVTCIWLLPFYRTPNRDNGYDIEDYYSIDPRHGTLEDFVEFVHRAGEHGIRVVADLVVNHTSDRHPWFQAARRDPASRYRDYYVWAQNPPPIPPDGGTIFPGQENSVWTWDEVGRAYYYHRFYHFEPELKAANPDVQEEIYRIMDFWLSFGVSGFRVDAASHMIAEKGGLDSTRPPDPHGILKEMRRFVSDRRPGTVLLGESDVRVEEVADYFGAGDELNLLFNFLLDNYLFLALAREEAEPLASVLNLIPSIPHEGQWVNFLRNLDELDLERLTEEERQDVYRVFAPDEDMRIYGRGIRRRMAPMLGGDRRKLEMAYSLLFSLPGSPMLVYGDEIGMGEDLSLDGRDAVRTPMQWSKGRNAGFSGAAKSALRNPVVDEEPFSYREVNVAAQEEDPESLLSWMRALIGVRRRCPEFGWGPWRLIHSDEPGVFAHRCEWRGGHVAAVHNLRGEGCTATLRLAPEVRDGYEELLGGARHELDPDGGLRVELGPYGYLWLRLRKPH